MGSSMSQLRFIAFCVSISVSADEEVLDDQILWRAGHFFAHPTLLNGHDTRKAIPGLVKGL